MSFGKAFASKEIPKIEQFCLDNQIELTFWNPSEMIRGEKKVNLIFERAEELRKVIDFILEDARGLRRQWQKAWRHRKIAEGICGVCGSRPITEGSKAACAVCIERAKQLNRKASLFSQWQRGGRGTVPINPLT